MVSRIIPLVVAAALLAVAFPNADKAADAPAAGHHEHGTAGGVQSLDVYADGDRLHVFFAEPREGKPALFHQCSDDAGASWSQPQRVDAGMPPAHSPHRGMDPQIAAIGDKLVAVWTSPGTDQWGGGPMAIALSNDSGKTWRGGPNPADDNSTTGHGFIDIAADSAGTFHLTWLDSRDGKQGLRYARSTDAGKTWSPNQTVKAATCECCSNALAVGPDRNVAILFRDGSPRDTNAALSPDGGSRWLTPVRVGEFNWQFNGCPHVGGGVAFSQSALHAIVWSGMTEHAGIHYVASSDRGRSWSQSRPLGSPTASHPDIATGGERIAAVWDDRAGEHAAIWASASRDGGKTWTDSLQLSKGAGNATHPRIVRTGAGFRAFWTESPPKGPAVWRSAPIP